MTRRETVALAGVVWGFRLSQCKRPDRFFEDQPPLSLLLFLVKKRADKHPARVAQFLDTSMYCIPMNAID